MRFSTAFVPFVLLVAACATPEERCIARSTKDLRVVDALIAEAEATLARGYAVEEVHDTRLRFTFCRDDDGKRSMCWIEEPVVTTRPVAVDLEDERRKLASLRAKRDELSVRARSAIAACRAGAQGQ